PGSAHAERDRRLLQIEGKLAFALIGVLASVAGPLAEAEISIFAVSTYDTDYLLVSENDLDRATQVLDAAGHTVRQSV
ncbi:MAG TPA: ACT domain-containing protein, partial [Candidatus Acidoferrum sp.]|nr:ACT domain-containing protein [Candidatus Acidoferrum sp.]